MQFVVPSDLSHLDVRQLHAHDPLDPNPDPERAPGFPSGRPRAAKYYDEVEYAVDDDIVEKHKRIEEDVMQLVSKFNLSLKMPNYGGQGLPRTRYFDERSILHQSMLITLDSYSHFDPLWLLAELDYGEPATKAFKDLVYVKSFRMTKKLVLPAWLAEPFDRDPDGATAPTGTASQGLQSLAATLPSENLSAPYTKKELRRMNEQLSTAPRALVGFGMLREVCKMLDHSLPKCKVWKNNTLVMMQHIGKKNFDVGKKLASGMQFYLKLRMVISFLNEIAHAPLPRIITDEVTFHNDTLFHDPITKSTNPNFEAYKEGNFSWLDSCFLITQLIEKKRRTWDHVMRELEDFEYEVYEFCVQVLKEMRSRDRFVVKTLEKGFKWHEIHIMEIFIESVRRYDSYAPNVLPNKVFRRSP